MLATTQKIGWARRAIAEIKIAQAKGSRDDFQYHFGAFLAFLGALRQFVALDRPHRQWVWSMDYRDMSYCTCVDLRNVEYHIDNTVGTPHSVYDVKITEPVPGSPDPTSLATTTGIFYVNPNLLPPDFAIIANVGVRPTKNAELALLATKAAVEVAEEATDYFEYVLLPAATSRGILLP